jgi:hypothetical protein
MADVVNEHEGSEESEELDDEDVLDVPQESDESMTASEDETSWISWFVSIRGNDFFCEVEESFVQDDFNLTGLSSQVPYYDYALDMILDVDIPLGERHIPHTTCSIHTYTYHSSIHIPHAYTYTHTICSRQRRG